MYYQKKCECFSEWTSREMKEFSSAIGKFRGYTVTLLQQKKNLCEIHKGDPKRERFSRPADIAKDIRFWEIKVDQSNKLRIHGFFISEVFFLVWLDRQHQCFDG
jgi:hypothetical protein